MFLFSRFFRFDVYTYAGHRKKTASSSYCDSPIDYTVKFIIPVLVLKTFNSSKVFSL